MGSVGSVAVESSSNLVLRPPIAADVLVLLSLFDSNNQISFPVVFSVQGDGEGAEEAT